MVRTTTLGITIQRIPFSETSQVVHFLTPDLGRVVCVAKGAFRDKNTFQGPLDLMVLSEIVLTRRRGGTALLNRRKLLHHYPGIRRNLDAFARAALVGELLRRGLEEGQGDNSLFPRVAGVLDLLDAHPEQGESAVLAFQGAFLNLLGYGPVFHRCVECGARPRPGHRLFAYPRSGGVVCRRCGGKGPDRADLSWEGAQWLQRASRLKPGRFPGPEDPPPPGARGELWAFFRCFFQYFLEKRIHSYAFIMALERFSRGARPAMT